MLGTAKGCGYRLALMNEAIRPGPETPLQAAAVGVERELEDAIPSFHADGLILGGVLCESGHGPPSFTVFRGTCSFINELVAVPVIYLP